MRAASWQNTVSDRECGGDAMAKLINLRTKEEHDLGAKAAVIGRHPSCHIRVMEKQVSRAHCRIARSGDDWVLTDTGSMLGTYVNGDFVMKPHRLEPGDQIKVGTEAFAFDSAGDGPRKHMTLRPLSEAAPDELVPFDIPGRRRVRPLPVVVGLAIVAVVVGGFVAVLALTRQTPSQVVRRAATLLRTRQARQLWALITDERRQAMTFNEFDDEVQAVPEDGLAALHTLKLGNPYRTENGMVVPVYVQIQDRPLSGEVVLFRESGEWRIHSAPTAWLAAVNR